MEALAKCPYLDELHDGEDAVVCVAGFDRYCLLCNCRLKSNDILVREVCAEPNDEFKACPMYKEESTILKLRREKSTRSSAVRSFRQYVCLREGKVRLWFRQREYMWQVIFIIVLTNSVIC